MNGISSTASRSSFQSLPDAPQPHPTGADSPQPASSPSTPGNSQTLTRMARDTRPPLAGQQQATAATAKAQQPAPPPSSTLTTKAMFSMKGCC